MSKLVVGHVFRLVLFHTQQVASTRRFTTLHCCNMAYLQRGGGGL